MPKVASRVAGLAAAGLLGVGALLISGTGSGAVPAPGLGSAFGVSATGVVAIAPTPTAPPNSTLATIDQQPLLTTGVLSASSTPNATGVTSTASVADVNALVGSVRATLLASTCTASGTTLTGSSTFTNLMLTGLPPIPVPGVPPLPGLPITVPVNPPPNTVITIPGVATVVLNEQITSNGGQTLTVNAVRITGLVPGVTQEVTIADSVCTLAAAASSTTTAPATTASTTPVSSTPATTPTAPPTTGSTPATTPTTTRGSSGTGTAPGATPVRGRPAFTG